MPPASADLVRLAQLNATTWEDAQYTYVKHTYHGWQKEAIKENIWRRTYKPIGQGGFGAVFREECVEGSSKGETRAVKVLLKPNSSDAKSIDYSRELEAIARFSELRFIQYFVSSQGWYDTEDTIHVVMELVPHGNLQQYIGSGMPEHEVQLIVRQVLQGLSYMHHAGYTHRDLKPPVRASTIVFHFYIDFVIESACSSKRSSMACQDSRLRAKQANGRRFVVSSDQRWYSWVHCT